MEWRGREGAGGGGGWKQNILPACQVQMPSILKINCEVDECKYLCTDSYTVVVRGVADLYP